ncbi:hypothetical protein RUM43_000078 [Polyplax serrata]|uniref:Uncharacterized protein n=1 Tax=Polyplax serrata TaxID=468196 RepID=A0AAN8SBY1_POLSC
MSFPKKATPKVVVYYLTTIAILSALHLTYAKRGCAAFGHSCFGGHGKRTDTDSVGGEVQDDGIGFRVPNEDLSNSLNSDEFMVPAENFRRGRSQLENVQHHHYGDVEDYLKLAYFVRKWLTSDYLSPVHQEGRK